MSESEKRIHHRAKLLKPVICEVGTGGLRAVAYDVETLNASMGGICILTERALEPGRVVMLRCSDQCINRWVPSLAEVRWVAQSDGRFMMGLKFLTPGS
jgi:hypothetical protein